MKNDTQLKITCLTNENKKDEFHFDYFDKEANLLGTIAIDESGRLGWAIWNDEYQKQILATVSYILGKDITNSIEDVLEAKEPDQLRWGRVQEYIEKRGLIVNYQQSVKFYNVIQNAARRRR